MKYVEGIIKCDSVLGVFSVSYMAEHCGSMSLSRIHVHGGTVRPAKVLEITRSHMCV